MELGPDSSGRQSSQADQRDSVNSVNNNPSDDIPEVVFLRDDVGAEYVFPFELCRSKEDVELLWKEIYAKHDPKLLEKINKGEYDVLAGRGRVLPSVWSALVRPNVVLQIVFPVPTYPKISLDHIDIETLDYYGLPWVYDPSGQYVIIMRELSSSETDMIFEHTRRARIIRGRERASGYVARGMDPEREIVYERRRSRSPPRIPSPSRHDPPEPVRTVTFDVDSPRPPMPPRDSDFSSSEDSSDSFTSSSDSSIVIIHRNPPKPPRDVVAPTDTEGNPLSFQVNTKHVQKLIEFNKGPGPRISNQEPSSTRKDVGNFRIETFRITRAMIDETQGRSQIQIHVLPGPENPQLQSSVTSTWCHISANQLDFTHFRDVCLTLPHLSDRLRKLTSEMLKKVYTEKVKPFDGGMFIESGAVLRADETDQPDPQSVIFSCVPYFALQSPPKKAPRTENNLFPQRTLMQTFYPYEPVGERDEEQSYRRFGEDRSENIIHVPNLWIMNIGSTHVVTCGHMLLNKEMTDSMAIIEEEIKQLSMKPIAENNLTNIRFTDWEGRDFVFPLSACRSYFQMEAKAREIGYMVNDRSYNAKVRLQYRSQEECFQITPRKWKDVVKRTDLISINIASVRDDETDQLSPTTSDDCTTIPLKNVLPFFHWPQKITEKVDEDNSSTETDLSSAPQPSNCLEQVEKALTTETLEGSFVNAVDETFTSTDHYKSLRKTTYAAARVEFASLRNQSHKIKKDVSCSTFHQITIEKQRAGMLERSIEFFDTGRMICDLFVRDTDESNILSKIWGVMAKISECVAKLESYRPSDQPSDGDSAAKQDESWLIRPTVRPCLVSRPEGSPELVKSIEKCKRCRNFRSFDSREDALRHLQRHLKGTSESQKPDQRNPSSSDQTSMPNVPVDPQTKAWIIADTEFWHEQTNAGVLEILTKACMLAKHILSQAQELTQGVVNEDGQMSDLYTLPKGIWETFRVVVVFFMATERALDEAVKARGQYHRLKNTRRTDALSYSKRGLGVLENFKGDAIRSLMIARSHLCYMARSDPPIDITKHLSRGPQYICGWLMRRLLLKPIQKRASIGDLYRDYISRLQFQVSHRPSKRLLRDLNFLQEELSILASVNTQQAKLVRNYLNVLEDTTYEKEIPSRQSMFPYESILLGACLENLDLVMEDYEDVIRRCGPLASRTKQSLEINDEDHGKAIMVFTVVTVIFLPLSFATSYLGMNTSDIRDMDQKQSLFWTIAIPLTAVTVGACLLIGYNGEEIREMFMWLYRKAMGKQQVNSGGAGISVARRKRPLNPLGSSSSSTTLESSAFPNEIEVIRPRPVFDYSNMPYPSGSWIEETAYTEPSRLRSTQARHAMIERRSRNRSDYVEMDPEPSYRMRRDRSEAPRYSATRVEDDEWYLKQRRGKDTYNHYYDPPIPDYHETNYSFVEPPRRSSNRPRSSRTAEVPVRQPSARTFDLDHDNDSEANGYTWGKKTSSRRHRHSYR